MEQYTVTGMSCAACSARVEKAVAKVPGVTACSVSLLTNSMGVEGSADPAAVIAAVETAGYGAATKSGKQQDGKEGANGIAKKQGGRTAERQGNSCFKEKVDCILRISCSADVLFDGAYDVGMAGSENTGRESCGDGIAPDAAYDCGHDCQSEVFCQWIQRIVASGSEYGHTCGTRLRCFICV